MRKRDPAQQPYALITLLPAAARRRARRRRRWEPPDTLYFVSCGRNRPDETHLYRQQGWARNRLRIASTRTQQARMYKAVAIQWVDVTADQDDVYNDKEVRDLLAWAGNESRSSNSQDLWTGVSRGLLTTS